MGHMDSLNPSQGNCGLCDATQTKTMTENSKDQRCQSFVNYVNTHYNSVSAIHEDDGGVKVSFPQKSNCIADLFFMGSRYGMFPSLCLWDEKLVWFQHKSIQDLDQLRRR